MSKERILKTKRLLISPMSDARLEELIASTQDEALKQAYTQMLDGCKADPKNRLWYTAWEIFLREDNTSIGDLGFKGPQKNGAVEIGYGLSEPYWGKGYATEAVRVLIDWAFSQENVYFMEAETASDNAASQRILKKLQFQEDGIGEEGPRFVLEKPMSSWLAVYMCIGMSVGLSLGSAFQSVSIGMCIGLALGVGLGCALDASERKKRNALRKKRT